jgi:hypothetical protein
MANDQRRPVWLLARSALTGALGVLTVYPETKGQSLESMSAHLGLH